jgi:hypothetical protein
MRDVPVTPAAGTRPTPTRSDLVARWQAARRRRDAAAPGSEEQRQAIIELGELEVQINAVDVLISEGRDVAPARPDSTPKAKSGSHG